MDRLLFLIDPAPDAVQVAADLFLMLMTKRDITTPLPNAVHTRTHPETQQIEIIAEYGENRPSAPLLHPLQVVKKSKVFVGPCAAAFATAPPLHRWKEKIKNEPG